MEGSARLVIRVSMQARNIAEDATMVAVGLYGVAAGVLVLAAGVGAVWVVVLDVLERVDVLMLRVRSRM